MGLIFKWFRKYIIYHIIYIHIQMKQTCKNNNYSYWRWMVGTKIIVLVFQLFSMLGYVYLKGGKNFVSAHLIDQRTGTGADIPHKVHFSPLIL